jgi:hypothetical protein
MLATTSAAAHVSAEVVAGRAAGLDIQVLGHTPGDVDRPAHIGSGHHFGKSVR